MLDIVGEEREHELEFRRDDQFWRLHDVNDAVCDGLRILHVAFEDLMIDYLVDRRERVIVQNQHVWRRNIRLLHLLQKHLPSIDHQLPILYQLRNSCSLYAQRLQLIVQYLAWERVGSDDKIGDLLSFCLYHKRSYLYLLILETLTVDVEKLQSVILFILRNLCVYVLIDIIENICKVLLFAHRLNLLVVADALPAPARPAAVGNGHDFKSHFVPQLLHVLEQLLIEVKSAVAAVSPVKHGQ